MDNKLQKLRKKVEKIDYKIINLIGERQKLAPQFASVKRKMGLALHQQQRENELLKKYEELGKKSNISSNLIRKLFPLLFHDSLKRQRQHLKKKD